MHRIDVARASLIEADHRGIAETVIWLDEDAQDGGYLERMDFDLAPRVAEVMDRAEALALDAWHHGLAS